MRNPPKRNGNDRREWPWSLGGQPPVKAGMQM